MGVVPALKHQLFIWGEKYLFAPGPLEKTVSYLLFPLSMLYCLIVWLKYLAARPYDHGLPVIGIGNLIVGGSGKTPLGVSLAERYQKPAVVLRGYGRQSRGLHLVKDFSGIVCDVATSGDEAMLYAILLPQALVIVSEDRQEGIIRAKELGAEIVFLDDAYSKHHIKKLDILILSEQKNTFCLPSGPFRERLWQGKSVLCVREGSDFSRHVSMTDARDKMVLVTAISKPQRLDPFLDERVVEKVYFPDHYCFEEEELQQIFQRSGADSLLVTRKDAVKMSGFDLPISYLELSIALDEHVHRQVEEYAKIPPLNHE